MNSIDEIKSFYDEATFRKLHGFIYTNNRVEYAWQSLNTVFNYIKPKKVLEIGCGIGEISYRLAIENAETIFTGFDISERSVNIASSLFKAPNLSYVRADSITEATFLSGEKYDVIFLMDVYEHIPVSFRNELHAFIRNLISEKAFVFLSCPTPQHLSYLKDNIPTEIQPVDEDITLKELINFSHDTGIRLISYKEVSVWKAADYFHAIFSNFLNMQNLSDYQKTKEARAIGLKNEIIKKIKSKVQPSNHENILDIKRKMIRDALGEDVLNKVKSYKR